MPVYQFRNIETGDLEDHMMSYTKLEEFKEQNPHLERYFSPENLPVFGDGMRMNVPGIGQPDAAFEHGVIQRIKETVPGNRLNETHKTKLPKWI